MDRETYITGVLNPLKQWSHLGERIDPFGTHLIGRFCKDHPLAYMHEVYLPATEEDIRIAQKHLRVKISNQMQEFLLLSNGLSFFSPAGVHVFGVNVAAIYPESVATPWRFPNDIVSGNSVEWLEDFPSTTIMVARNDGVNSYLLLLEEGGPMIEYDPIEDEEYGEWDSFDHWLLDEIENLANQHDENGTLMKI